jgi:ABC transporter DrrB family efflux protein
MDEAERCTDVGYIHMSKLIVCGKPDELKQLPAVTPAGMRRWELEVANPTENLSRLRALPRIADATLFGQTIHLLASEQMTEADVARQLAAAPQMPVIMRPIGPSLEDVFVTLTRAQEKGAEPEVRGSRSARIEDGSRTGSAGASPSQPGAMAAQKILPTPAASATANVPIARHRHVPVSRATDGLIAMLLKEFSHIRREPATIFFMLVVPVLQTIIFGYAIETEIENIPTVVYDLDGRRAAHELVEAFRNTRTFLILDRVYDEDSFRRSISSGRAKVGVRVPPDYTERLLRQQQVQVQVLIDGSDSQVATTALNATNLLGISKSRQLAIGMAESLERVPARDPLGHAAMPIEMRPRLLYNPDLESSHFFVPGLVGIIMQLVTLFLTSFAIVRERELGTLEQLFVTPVGRLGLLLGKLVPYALIGFLEMLIVLTVMVYVFRVPINGNLGLLLVLSTLFLVCALGLGLFVSTLARTQLQAMQFAFLMMLPSVLLSGFMFPRNEMPSPIYLLSFAIPVTYFLEILRGIVLRGADFLDLVPQVIGLAVCTVLILALAVGRFRKQLA